jgi:ATP-dependent Clp protease ATP-binding subunit ClpC
VASAILGRVFERFTDRARRVLTLAQEEARLLGHSFIGTEHLLLGLINDGDGLAAKALESLGLSLDVVRRRVTDIVPSASAGPSGSPPFTPRAKKVLELSLREALQLGHSYIGTEHILLGVVREGEGVAAQVLISLGADLGRVRQRALEFMSGNVPDPAVPRRGRSSTTERMSASPLCPKCNVDLGQSARLRRIAVAPGPGSDEESISIEVVYCAGCGVTLEMFKSEPAPADRADS